MVFLAPARYVTDPGRGSIPKNVATGGTSGQRADRSFLRGHVRRGGSMSALRRTRHPPPSMPRRMGCTRGPVRIGGRFLEESPRAQRRAVDRSDYQGSDSARPRYRSPNPSRTCRAPVIALLRAAPVSYHGGVGAIGPSPVKNGPGWSRGAEMSWI